MIKALFGVTEEEVRAEVYKRGGDAILEKYPEIQGCVIDELARAVLDATVEADADDIMRAYMTMAGWW